jgi:hypothetical protein
MTGTYLYPSVKEAQKRRLRAARSKNFTSKINEELEKHRVGAVRIHDSGDYFNEKYLDKWIEIAKQNPEITFYSYTKSVHFFKEDYYTWKKELPDNFVVTLSYGGKYDHLINPVLDKHALVFESLEELLEYNYSDTSKYDDNAYKSEVTRIGLIAKKNRKKEGWRETKEQVLELISA